MVAVLVLPQCRLHWQEYRLPCRERTRRCQLPGRVRIDGGRRRVPSLVLVCNRREPAAATAAYVPRDCPWLLFRAGVSFLHRQLFGRKLVFGIRFVVIAALDHRVRFVRLAHFLGLSAPAVSYNSRELLLFRLRVPRLCFWDVCGAIEHERVERSRNVSVSLLRLSPPDICWPVDPLFGALCRCVNHIIRVIAQGPVRA